ncbi:MAG: Mu transposase C-terminal domain-containing protein [Albidovulum sp.]
MTPARQEFFTARELAEIAATRGIVSFPMTERGVRSYVERDGWNDLSRSLVRWRKGEGRPSREYHWSILPALMQLAITADETRTTLIDAQALEKVAALRQVAAIRAARASSRAHEVEMARGEVLISIEGYAISCGQSRAWGIARFLEAQKLAAARQEARDRIGRGEFLTPPDAAILTQPDLLSDPTRFDLRFARLAVANDRKGAILSRSTIYGWFKARDTGGIAALSPVPPREAEPIPHAFMEFMKFYAMPSKPTIAAAHAEYIQAASARDGIRHEPISLGQATRILRRRLNNIEKHVGREGILTLKSRLAYVQRSTDGMWPTTIYTADGKTFDAEVADPVSRNPMKPEITSILDVATRKCVGFAVSRKENVIAVTEGLRRACISHGIPAIFYTDRGPGYRNKTFDGRDGVDLGGLMARLGITKMHALPYNSQGKGIIERFNAVWNDLARTLPTYLGQEMDKEASSKVHKLTRSEIAQFGSSRILPAWDEFLAMCEATVAAYNDRPHSGLPSFEDPATGQRRSMTPNEAWAAHVADGFEPVPVSAGEADDLFRPYEVRTVRRALVEWNTNSYYHDDLEKYHETRVAVGYDLHQADRVWVREIDEESGLPGSLICVAVFGGNSQRYVPLSFQRAAEEGRVRAQLRRIGKRAEAIQDQLRAPLLEHSPQVVMPDLKAAPEPIPVRTVQEDAPPATAAITSDADLAKLCLADPGQLTQGRAHVLREVMSRRNGRELLRISGVDLDELDALLRSAA